MTIDIQLDRAPKVDIGISKDDRKEVSDGLCQVLADSFTLYLKTHQFHWNVTGPMFNTLHTMFEKQYTEEWHALDEIAERIRALGFEAPGTPAEFIRLTSLDSDNGPVDTGDWREMVRQLTLSNEGVCRTAREVLETANEAGDDPTADLLTRRLVVHEKNAWMLRSLLE